MSKMKKVLLMCTAYVLVAALAIGGTIAYLQDSDSDVNVMTLGNVKIEQHEYEREIDVDGNYVTDATYGYVLKDFTQGKPLYPATDLDANGNPYNYGAGDYGPTRVKMSQVGSHGSMDVFVNENAIDKFVTVENTGKTDAYVRTIIAMEIGSLTEARFDEVISTSSFMTSQGVWKVTDIGVVEIDGNNYYVSEYIYKGAKALGGVHENGVLPAGDTTYPSLCQVYMTASATNEDVEKIDGNGNGTYDILVVSQAVQAAGFENAKTALDTAFGKSSEKAAEWFGGTSIPTAPFVTTADELAEALANGDSVSLAKDIALDEAFAIPAGKEATIDLAGNELSFVSTEAKASSAIVNKGTLTIKNGTVTYEGVGDPNFGYGTNTINNGGKLIIDGATVINTTDSGSSVAIDCSAGAELIINSGEIISQKNAIRLCPFGSGAINCTINGGSITGARAIQIQLPSNKPADAPDINLTVNGGKLTGNSGLALYSYSAGQSFANVDVTITGGTFNGDVCFGGGNAKTTQENVTVTGGTFSGYLGRYLANDGWEDIAKP